MTETKHLKPAPGLIVRYPDGRRLPDEGKPVPMNTYWARRLAAGDVVEVAAAPAPPATKPASSRKPAATTPPEE